MRTTKTNVQDLIKAIETNYNVRVRYTCCSPDGRLRWWVSVENKNNMYSWSEINGSTSEVYAWLKGVLSGLYLVKED